MSIKRGLRRALGSYRRFARVSADEGEPLGLLDSSTPGTFVAKEQLLLICLGFGQDCYSGVLVAQIFLHHVRSKINAPAQVVSILESPQTLPC